MKVVLTIAGYDSSGGAGIQADIKTFEVFGLFATSAITVLTAQNTTGVSETFEVSPEFVRAQIHSVMQDFDIAAIKIGMLYSCEIITVVHEINKDLDIPIVLDPIFISKAGYPLLKPNAVESMKTFFEDVTLLTPNTYEAEELFGYEFGDSNSLKELQKQTTPILIKHQGKRGDQY